MARALRQALEDKGYISARDRLNGIADAALAANPRGLGEARQFVSDRVINHADLLWELFSERWARIAIDLLLHDATKRKQAAAQSSGSGALGHADTRAAQPRQPGGPHPVGPSADQVREAREHAVRVLSKLDTFKVNGRPIGDCTANEALAWAESRQRDVRFVRLMVTNLPPDQPIRRFVLPNEADDLYVRAQMDIGNE
jgi:hypothetical protein